MSQSKIDKYEYLTKNITPDQGRIIEKAKLTYSILVKAFEKQKQWKNQEKKKLNFQKL